MAPDLDYSDPPSAQSWLRTWTLTIQRIRPELIKSKCSRQVFDFCKWASMPSMDLVKGVDPCLYEELRQIARRYKWWKRIEADEGDTQGIPCPYPEVVGVQVRNLHRVTPGINRFFICRQQDCTPAGSFFGLNTDWISTVDAGEFACPACGTPYRRNLVKTGLIPANHLWHSEFTGEFMLAEGPESCAEKCINEFKVKMAEHAADVHFTDLSHEELQLKIGEVVAKHGVKFAWFMQLSPAVISNVTTLNAHRGTSLPYSWDHIKDGYTGSFYKYTKGVTPVMKSDQVKDYLALVYCRMLQDYL